MKAGDITVISCSNCNRQLLDILHIQPELDIELNIKVGCPCGDASFINKIHGRFSYSPHIKYINNNDIVDLYIKDTKMNENEILFDMGEING